MHERHPHLSFRHIVLVGAGRHQSAEAWDHEVEDRTNDGDRFGNAGNVSGHLPNLLICFVHLKDFVIEVLRGPLLVVLVIDLNSTDLEFLGALRTGTG